MVINVDELQVSDVSVGQSVQVTADAVPDKTYTGTVTRVSMKGLFQRRHHHLSGNGAHR